MLANPTKQQQSLEIPISSPPYAQLSNLEAVYAVLPNEHGPKHARATQETY